MFLSELAFLLHLLFLTSSSAKNIQQVLQMSEFIIKLG